MSVDILGTSCDNAEAWFNKSLRPRKPEGSLGRTAQDGHLDSHTAPELCRSDCTQKDAFALQTQGEEVKGVLYDPIRPELS